MGKTAQHCCSGVHHPFQKHFKSGSPAANAPRLNEWVTADTFFSGAPAADDGAPGHGGGAVTQICLELKSRHLEECSV